MDKDEVHELVKEAVMACRLEVDVELQRLHTQDQLNAWTEDRAMAVATMAADIAVKKITDNFYLSIGKKTVATLGALVVAGTIIAKDSIKNWVGLK